MWLGTSVVNQKHFGHHRFKHKYVQTYVNEAITANGPWWSMLDLCQKLELTSIDTMLKVVISTNDIEKSFYAITSTITIFF